MPKYLILGLRTVVGVNRLRIYARYRGNLCRSAASPLSFRVRVPGGEHSSIRHLAGIAGDKGEPPSSLNGVHRAVLLRCGRSGHRFFSSRLAGTGVFGRMTALEVMADTVADPAEGLSDAGEPSSPARFREYEQLRRPVRRAAA